MINAQSIFRLPHQVVLERFDESGLAFQSQQRRVIDLTPMETEVLTHTDGHANALQIAAQVSQTLNLSRADALQLTISAYTEWMHQGFVELCEPDHANKENMVMEGTTSLRYKRNPDVTLREEDPQEGGLLFHPDTNQVKVLNPTGLLIWQQCDGAHAVSEIVAALQTTFEDAPADAIAQDVQEFLDDMVTSGFISPVES